ncbi:NAD(P)/FAD-dependent oxidoreductase [Nocardia asiatica]|uniref:NAD(P)/FAD-dependent oxidoreductase n=1 Tax=Nocardia asiatica TaxID=209252 RepID=UPI003EE05849
MSAGRLLVVGAGQAGVQVASSARELGWSGPITLVGQEPDAPYGRPPLSKAFLQQKLSAESLALRSAAFYREQGVDLVLGERVDHLDLSAGSATAVSGRSWGFDRLVLATGARPRALPIEGAELDGVAVLRDVQHAYALSRRLTAVSDMVVIGGGFIGLEVAATAASKGIRAVVVEAAPALLNRVVSTATAEAVETAHRAAGVDVRIGVRPVRLLGERGAVSAVELADGTELPAQLVLIAVGAQPNEDLARAAGLYCDGGIGFFLNFAFDGE